MSYSQRRSIRTHLRRHRYSIGSNSVAFGVWRKCVSWILFLSFTALGGTVARTEAAEDEDIVPQSKAEEERPMEPRVIERLRQVGITVHSASYWIPEKAGIYLN